LCVVEVAEDLDVVAESVDEEVRAGIDAADDKFVAIAFTLVDGDARYVACHVGNALKGVVLNEFTRHHRAAPAPQQSRVEVDFLQRMMPAFAPSPARPAFGQLAAIVPMPHVGN
jgi:hypothetical protein